MTTEVLIVGAGPTGLVLALWLRRAGVAVRIIDKAAEPGTTSRALAVHARTLESYRQLGLADQVVGRGLELLAANLWVGGAHAARIPFGEIGKGLSPFPFVVIYPQDEHEAFLVERLRSDGVEVERTTELVRLEEHDDVVIAVTRRKDGTEASHEAAFVVGCDGARSMVRELCGIGFPGSTYEHVFYVADVEIGGAVDNREINVALDEADLLVIFPMKGEHRARLIGTVRKDAEARRDLELEDVSREAVDRLGVEIRAAHWFSTYRVHHRVAASFGRGRVFLAGDSAHIHSPVGGQGMNTGIGDAVNLGWKLVEVLRGRATSTLLDSYEPERIAFARRLVATTDRAFTVATRSSALARWVRTDVMPRLAPTLARREVFRRFAFRTVSQIMVEYRKGPLAEGRAGSIQGGDRLPWIEPASGGADNFTPLATCAWQVHVHGRPPEELSTACKGLGLQLEVFPWTEAAAAAGYLENASYLVRPDGYVALADPDARAGSLAAYFDARGWCLRMR
ncbi:MAG: NAD(P)-binding protein [Polyangiaceae bacterium]|nr:NAD(P)-binding protein [Polyangiaceae bacterium]